MEDFGWFGDDTLFGLELDDLEVYNQNEADDYLHEQAEDLHLEAEWEDRFEIEDFSYGDL